MAAKGRVSFDQKYCKGCGLCISVCQKKIIALDLSKVNSKGYNPANVENMDECIGCASCAMMCPDAVITVERL